MIKSFKHKGLKRLFEKGHDYGVNPLPIERLRYILALLETSETVEDMNLPGLSFDQLKGKRKNTLAVKVSGNWRVTFKVKNGDILEMNYEDYH
jgi:toxin HigB-1